MDSDLTNKTIVVVVPHQDDELNLVGPLIPFLSKKGFQVHVLFTTNGDYHSDGNKRYKEALSVAKCVGISKITYLGYPDSGPNIGDDNIYNCKKGNYVSPKGKKDTCGVAEKDEFFYETHKRHHGLSIVNMHDDLKNYIISTNPFAVFSVDYDSQADHRIASILMDGVMKEVGIRFSPPPLYFKGFCYLGSWLGPNDYFDQTPKPTINVISGRYENPKPYLWDNRVSLGVDPRYYTIFYWRSLLYKAYKKYHSQKGRQYFFRCLNTDKVFWKRDLTNIAFSSTFISSSGNTQYLNDGKLIDSSNVRSGFECELERTWNPDDDDDTKTIFITLEKQTKYLRGNIYFSTNTYGLTVLLKVNDTTQTLISKHTVCEFLINNEKQFLSFSISFKTKEKQKVYVSEIELFDNNHQEARFNNFISIFKNYETKRRSNVSVTIAKKFKFMVDFIRHCYLRISSHF